MSALRFFSRRRRAGDERSYPVHTMDPLRHMQQCMCGVLIELADMIEERDPIASHKRQCVRCEAERESAEERATRVRGIIGGWESVTVAIASSASVRAWWSVDSLGRWWYVHENVSNGGKLPNAKASWVAIVVNRVLGPDNRIESYAIVRKLGQKNRARWRNDAEAMRGCEDLARNGEFLLDRPPMVKKGDAA